MAIVVDLDPRIGETFTIRVTAVKKTDGSVVDLTGATIEFRIGSSTWSVNHFTKAGSLTTDGSDGKAEVTVTDEETDLLTPGEWEYSLRATDPLGNEQVLKDGWLRLRPAIPAA